MSANYFSYAVNRTIVIAALAGAAWMPAAHAQNFPTKSIRLIVSFPPGGLADIIARMLAVPLGAALGQSVVVENRAGGGTVIATEIVAHAPADGHTMLLAGFPFVANAALRSDLPYNTQKDFAAVARIESSAWMVATHPSLPVKSIKELIAFARARPGQMTFAANPAGSGAHLVGQMLKLTAKIDIVDVPYQGEVPAMIAVVGGHADIVVSHVPTLMPQLAAGRLRVLAVSSRTRLEQYKDVPTLAESAIPDFELSGTQGLVVPAATPKAVIARLSTEIGRAMALPAIHDNLVKQGLHPAPMTSAEYDAFLRGEFQKLQKLFKAANVTAS